MRFSFLNRSRVAPGLPGQEDEKTAEGGVVGAQERQSLSLPASGFPWTMASPVKRGSCSHLISGPLISTRLLKRGAKSPEPRWESVSIETENTTPAAADVGLKLGGA